MTGTFSAAAHLFHPPTIVLVLTRVKAGFPSPAEAYADQALNLHELAVTNPAATIFCWASGDSMEGAGVFSGDLLVVDRSLTPGAGDLVVANLEGEFTLKRLEYEAGRPLLVPANPKYPVLRPSEGQELTVFGVVRGIYRNLK